MLSNETGWVGMPAPSADHALPWPWLNVVGASGGGTPETIVPTTHGEVVITKHRVETVGKTPIVTPVASASTLALCGTQPVKTHTEVDPWNKRSMGWFQA